MSARFVAYILFVSSVIWPFAPAALAQVDYAIDDGFAELAIAITGGESAIWMTTFPVQPGAEMIDRIDVMFGRPNGSSPLNGRPVSILLYEDVDGGSPVNAVLRQTFDTVIANANSTVINQYALVPTAITGHLVAAVLFENASPLTLGIAPLDRTAPTLANRSYFGFSPGDLDAANLASLPPGTFGPIESFGSSGNWVLRAHGTPIPEPAGATLLTGLLSLAIAGRRAQRPALTP